MKFKSKKKRALADMQSSLGQVNRRLRWLVLGMVAVIVLLGVRLGMLQLGDHAQYAARAEDNRVSLRALPPNRGLITDRRGRVLAENRPAYRLIIVPERAEDLEQTLERLAGLVPVSEEEYERFMQQRRLSRPFSEIVLKNSLDEREIARIASHRHRLPGVDIEPYLMRHYPHDELFSHVIGYVGRLDQSDYQRLVMDNYRATTHIGKTGIERWYEPVLHGQSGLEQVETNARGRVLRVLERQDPVPGRDLRLNIDLDVQRAAYEALGDFAGAVIVLEVETGRVRALVSKPGFDANRFVHGIGHARYNRLLEDPQRPLFNRVLAGGYEPGSTIKPFIALAGLEAGLITPDTSVFSTGEYHLPGHRRIYRDWRAGGHGRVRLKEALAESVNVYFYDLAVKLDIDRISRELALFGFGRRSGLDLPGESSGILPTRTWKRATFGQPWFPGETVITGIGQGFTVVTPIQLAQATAALAGRGKTAPPALVGRNDAVQMVEHSDRWWDAAHEGMQAVIYGPRGTARAIARDLEVASMAGKTGTSQVFGRPDDEEVDTRREHDELPVYLRNHALFIAFAPVDEPRLAVTVVVEHGGGGASVAAPIAAEVINAAARAGL